MATGLPLVRQKITAFQHEDPEHRIRHAQRRWDPPPEPTIAMSQSIRWPTSEITAAVCPAKASWDRDQSLNDDARYSIRCDVTGDRASTYRATSQQSRPDPRLGGQTSKAECAATASRTSEVTMRSTGRVPDAIESITRGQLVTGKQFAPRTVMSPRT